MILAGFFCYPDPLHETDPAGRNETDLDPTVLNN